MKQTLRSYLKRRASLRLASRKIFAWFPASSAFDFPQAVCLALCMLFLRLPESSLLSFTYALRSASRELFTQPCVCSSFGFPQVQCLALGTRFVRLPASYLLSFGYAFRSASRKLFAWLCGSSSFGFPQTLRLALRKLFALLYNSSCCKSLLWLIMPVCPRFYVKHLWGYVIINQS